MLQRSPTYIGSLPDVDPIARKANKYLPEKAAHVVNRWKAIIFSTGQYQLARRFPKYMRKTLLTMAAAPTARGLRRREALRPALQPVGPAAVPGAERRSVQEHPPRAPPTSSPTPSRRSPRPASSSTPVTCSTPTSSSPQRVSTCGCSAVLAIRTLNGEPIDLTSLMTYKGMMFSGIPNLAITFGYTNASWTLKADLVSEFVCRVLNYMDANGFDTVVPAEPSADVDSGRSWTSPPATCLRSMDRCRSPARRRRGGSSRTTSSTADDPPGQGGRRGAALHQTPCARDGLVRARADVKVPSFR